MNRRYPEKPMVGVGAIIFRNDSVLLIQRGRQPSLGKWSIPGGLVEVGESLRDAVAREVLEESGLQVAVHDLVVALDRVIHDADGKIEYHYVLLDFLCEAGPGQPAPATDVLNCAFVPIDALKDFSLTDGTEQAILRAYSFNRGAHHPVYDPAY